MFVFSILNLGQRDTVLPVSMTYSDNPSASKGQHRKSTQGAHYAHVRTHRAAFQVNKRTHTP